MGTTYTVSSGNCPSFSSATSSSLLMLTAGPKEQFPRWHHSRRTLSVGSILRCPDLITVQCEFCAQFKKDAPHKNNVTRLYRQFVETGCLCKAEDMQLKMEEDGFVERLIFSDEATFHISGKVDTISVSGEPSNHMHR
jgi:hypothetical protein